MDIVAPEFNIKVPKLNLEKLKISQEDTSFGDENSRKENLV